MVDSPSGYVLDSFALLAYLQGEAGMPKVRATLEGAAAGRHRVYLSLINLGEVLYVVEREQGLIEAQQALAAVDQLPLEALPVTRAAVLAAAHVKARFPLSYADAFAVIAAQERGRDRRDRGPGVRAGRRGRPRRHRLAVSPLTVTWIAGQASRHGAGLEGLYVILVA